MYFSEICKLENKDICEYFHNLRSGFFEIARS